MNYEIIVSKDNPKIKLLKKLSQKKYREQLGLFFVENLVIIDDATTAGFCFESLFVTDEFLAKNKKVVEDIISRCARAQVFIIASMLNKSFSTLENPSGVCAIYAKPTASELLPRQKVIYFNSIGDPGNLGTMLRSAVAFDLKNIIVDETCADLYNSKTIAAAKDAIFKLNIIEDKDLKQLKILKKNMPIVSTQLDGVEDLNSLNKLKVFCLVLGDESHGVDEKIQKLADKAIKIKMSNNIESLNVASAAAIIFYKLYNN